MGLEGWGWLHFVLLRSSSRRRAQKREKRAPGTLGGRGCVYRGGGPCNPLGEGRYGTVPSFDPEDEGGSGGLVAAGAGESDPAALWPPSLFESKEGTDSEKEGTRR